MGKFKRHLGELQGIYVSTQVKKILYLMGKCDPLRTPVLLCSNVNMHFIGNARVINPMKDLHNSKSHVVIDCDFE